MGFLSVDSAAGDVEASSAGESSRMSATDCGVTASMGFAPSSSGGVKSENGMSPGADMKDSAGEFSNLTWGAEVGAAAGEAVLLSHDAMTKRRVRTLGVARDGIQFRGGGGERGAQKLSLSRLLCREVPSEILNTNTAVGFSYDEASLRQSGRVSQQMSQGCKAAGFGRAGRKRDKWPEGRRVGACFEAFRKMTRLEAGRALFILRTRCARLGRLGGGGRQGQGEEAKGAWPGGSGSNKAEEVGA